VTPSETAIDMESDDHPTLAEIYRRHGDEVRAYLRRRLHSPEDAEDLAQEAFLRLERTGKLESLENPRAYLLRIADNLVRDRVRRDGLGVFDHDREVTDVDFAHPSPSPEQTASAREDLKALAYAVAGLSDKVRQALILHKFHHLSHKEVARVMSISPRTVEKHLAKAIAQCRVVVRRGTEAPHENVVDFSNRPPHRAQPRG